MNGRKIGTTRSNCSHLRNYPQISLTLKRPVNFSTKSYDFACEGKEFGTKWQIASKPHPNLRVFDNHIIRSKWELGDVLSSIFCYY